MILSEILIYQVKRFDLLSQIFNLRPKQFSYRKVSYLKHKPMEQLIDALSRTIKGTSSEDIKVAQQQLNLLSKDVNFMQAIQSLLSESNTPAQLKKAAAVYVISHSRVTLELKDQSKINILCQKILQLLRLKTVQIKYKLHLSHAVEIMMSNPQRGKILRNAFIPNLLQLLKEIDYTNIDKSKDALEYLVFVGQIIMANPGFSQDINKFIQASFPPYLLVANYVIFQVESALNNKNQFEVFYYLHLLRLYSYLIKLYLRRFSFTEIKTVALLYDENLEAIFTRILALNFPNNNFPTSVFFVNQSQHQLSKIINAIKNNAIHGIHSSIKSLLNMVKQKSMLMMNKTFSQCKNYLSQLIKSLEKLLEHISGKQEKLSDQTPLRTAENIVGLINTLIKCNDFYGLFSECKSQLIENILFKILTPTHKDMEDYLEDPEQFMNAVFHLFDREPSKAKPKIIDSLQQQEQQYQAEDQTLKIAAANTLITLCKYQDGTSAEIFKLAANILEGRINLQQKRSKCLLLLVICIMKDVIRNRPDFHVQLLAIVTKILGEKMLPQVCKQQQKNIIDNMEYSYCLLTLYTYLHEFLKIHEGHNVVADHTFNLVLAIIKSPKVQEVPRLVSYSLIERLNHVSRQTDLIQQNNSSQILMALNQILSKSKHVSHRLLDSIYSVFKANDYQLINHANIVIDTIKCLCFLVESNLKDQSNFDNHTVNKCFNIIRDVGENNQFIPALIPDMQKYIMPLLPYLQNPKLQFDFEQDIFLLLTSFIEKSKQVTQNQLVMFEYIPKIFYNRYNLTFGQSFNTINTFMLYGKQILSKAPVAIKQILMMCKQSMFATQVKDREHTEGQNCQGVLIMQSLILCCGHVFDRDYWTEIIQMINERLAKNPHSNILKSNLYATLALALLGGFKFFDPQDNNNILERILSNAGCFDVEYSPKVLIVALSELMVVQNVDFIQSKLQYIFDMCITVLGNQISKKKIGKYFIDDVDSPQQKDYAIALDQLVNTIVKQDQFKYFKNKINWMRQNCHQNLMKAIQMLPQAKKDYLRSVLLTVRVMDQTKQIFTIKRT